MALMTTTNPQTLAYKLKNKHLDLSKYYCFDNGYLFYSFNKLYSIKLDGDLVPTYHDPVPTNFDKKKLTHVLRYVKMLIEEGKCGGPFVV
jgi:hypothetical protein